MGATATADTTGDGSWLPPRAGSSRYAHFRFTREKATNRARSGSRATGPLVRIGRRFHVATGNGHRGLEYDHGDSLLKVRSRTSTCLKPGRRRIGRNGTKRTSTSARAVPLRSPASGCSSRSASPGRLLLLRANGLGNGVGVAPAAHLQICEKNGATKIAMAAASMSPRPRKRGPSLSTSRASMNAMHAVKVEVNLLAPEPKMSVVTPCGLAAEPTNRGAADLRWKLVWVASYEGPPANKPGTLYGIQPPSGELQVEEKLGTFLDFATPSAGGGRLLVANGEKVTALTIATPPPPAPTTTTISSSANPALAGETGDAYGDRVPAPDFEGSVAFSEGSTPIPGCAAVSVNLATGGQATCSYSLPRNRRTQDRCQLFRRRLLHRLRLGAAQRARDERPFAECPPPPHCPCR